jgi:exosome complex RNA-binding protein Csl4
MAVEAKVLVDSKYVSSGTTTEYTAGAGVTALIDKATVCNVTGGAVTVDIHLVASGDTAATDNQLYAQLSVSANSTVALDAIQNQVLEAGDFIAAQASAGSSIVLRVSGREKS